MMGSGLFIVVEHMSKRFSGLSTSSQPCNKRLPALTPREQKIIRTALSGKGRWHLYLISLGVLLVVPIEGWEIARKLASPNDYGYTDYGIPFMVISIHIILFFKIKQRLDYHALIRKLNA